MPRGGKRQGTPGKAYSNRSDLQMTKPAMAAPKGLPYGGQTASLAAQRAVPVAPPPTQTAGAAAPEAAPQGPMPGSLGDFHRPTELPDQPVTAGSPSGAGPGPEMFQGGHPFQEDMDAKLRGLYLRFPYPELRDLLDDMDIV